MSKNGLTMVGNDVLAVNYKGLIDEIVGLQDQIKELKDRLEDLEGRFMNFAKPCAIGQDQLWEVVFNDILKQPVPNGTNLRNLI
jgi:ClpP class serine protease